MFTQIPHCFTIQSCWGHFVHEFQTDVRNLHPVAWYAGMIERVEYRLAYLAFCIQWSRAGEKLYRDLESLTELDSEYIQFGCAEWFWDNDYLNSYVVQVEPGWGMERDIIWVKMEEAIHLEQLKNKMFWELEKIARYHQIGGVL
jgi:hypothetical protein